ncbi:MAG: AraC family transcriptional regulator [Blastocatellia bacterium]|jgi:AraC family transcriptional regulator|nr:AraC family transcriptional regulator [Blastocatellia bacterium]
MKRTENQSDRIFLRPQYVAHYRRAQRTRWTSAARPDYATLFVLGGQLACDIDGHTIELAEADALLLDPGATATAKGRATALLSLTLSPSLMLDSAARTRLVGAGSNVIFASNVVRNNQRLMRLARDLADELTQEEAGQELVVAALIEQLVIELLRHHSNMRRSPELELSRAGLVDRRIRLAVELMHARLAENLPLEEIAGAAYLSPFHFARLFKKLTGATPHAYLAALRATRAQALLADTDFSITEVGSRVGYDSPSHFAKAFRQATGLSPRAFRNAVVRD